MPAVDAGAALAGGVARGAAAIAGAEVVAASGACAGRAWTAGGTEVIPADLPGASLGAVRFVETTVDAGSADVWTADVVDAATGHVDAATAGGRAGAAAATGKDPTGTAAGTTAAAIAITGADAVTGGMTGGVAATIGGSARACVTTWPGKLIAIIAPVVLSLVVGTLLVLTWVMGNSAGRRQPTVVPLPASAQAPGRGR